MNNPILSICIPTYNRSEKLKKQLSIIIPQLNQDVCLIIQDNNSLVPVAEIISDTLKSNLTINRNSVNIGADANIARCFENCNTKWLWVVSDDDYLTNNAIETVLNFIKDNQQAVFINLNAKKNIVTTGFYDFAKELNKPMYLSDTYWITKCIYNIDLLKPNLLFYYRNLSCMIGQLLLILKYLELNPNANCITSTSKIVLYNDPEFGWNLIDYIKRTNVIFEDFKLEDKKFLQSNILKAISTMYYNFLKYDYLKLERKELFYYLKLIVFKEGIINTLKFNLVNFIQIVFYLIFPKKFIQKIKTYKRSIK